MIPCSWSPWPTDRDWPMTGAEEARLVTGLAGHAGDLRPDHPHDRTDVTLIMAAARTGIDADELLERLPGRTPAGLLAAYRDVELLLTRVNAAWQTLIDTPTLRTLSTFGPAIKLLLPKPVGRIVTAAHNTSGAGLPAATTKTAARIAESRVESDGLEALLSTRTDQACLSAVGRKLYHPYQTCVWSGMYFQALRVGQLTPVRLAALLEHRDRIPEMGAAGPPAATAV